MRITSAGYEVTREELLALAAFANKSTAFPRQNGVYFAPSRCAMATNGHVAVWCRAAPWSPQEPSGDEPEADSPPPTSAPVHRPMLVPLRAITSAARWTQAKEHPITIAPTDGTDTALLSCDGTMMFTNLIADPFPPVDEVLPDETDLQSSDIMHMAVEYLALLVLVGKALDGNDPQVRVQCNGSLAPIRFDVSARDGTRWTVLIMPCHA